MTQVFGRLVYSEDSWKHKLTAYEDSFYASLYMSMICPSIYRLRRIKHPAYYFQMTASKALKLTINYEGDSQRLVSLKGHLHLRTMLKPLFEQPGCNDMDLCYHNPTTETVLHEEGGRERLGAARIEEDTEDKSESSEHVGTFLWEFGNPPTFEAPSRTEEEEQNCKPFSHLFLHLPAIVNAPPLPTPNHSKMKWSVHLMLVVCWRKKKKKKK
eukprot:Platyproteum_vivax@DN7658_c0_g2_i1.p1